MDYLAGQAGASIRFQGGNNAGHTVVNDLGTFKLHQVPSGVFNPDCLVVLGPGMVISPEKLTVELDEVKASGVTPKLAISDRATLCLPLHAMEDTLEEQRLGDGAYGSTRQGIAPAYGDRVMKKAILVGWLKQPEVLVERIQFFLDWKLPQLKALYPTSNSTRPPRRWLTGCWKCPPPGSTPSATSACRSKRCRPKARPCCSKPSWVPAVT